MKYPIEYFGFRKTDEFIDSKGIKSYVFSKDFVNFCIKKGDTFDIDEFAKIMSIQSDSLTEALKETYNLINGEH